MAPSGRADPRHSQDGPPSKFCLIARVAKGAGGWTLDTLKAARAGQTYSLWQPVVYALRLGTFGFGGPAALVGYMHQDLVERRGGISEADYNEFDFGCGAAILRRQRRGPDRRGREARAGLPRGGRDDFRRAAARSAGRGGLGAWKAQQGALDRKPPGGATRWVTRERPKIDRIACPWLIARFVEREAEFLYVPPGQVREAAQARDAVPYDVPEVRFTHEGERCSFDAFIRHYRLGADPALERLALIVRGADTARLALAPQAAGLAAVSRGLSRVFADDHEMLEHGMVLYDALYAWCREGQDEARTWNPQAWR